MQQAACFPSLSHPSKEYLRIQNLGANFKILWLEQYKTSQELQMLSPVIDEPAKFESKDIALVIPNQMISVDSVDKSLFA